jgi:hypothetical protein
MPPFFHILPLQCPSNPQHTATNPPSTLTLDPFQRDGSSSLIASTFHQYLINLIQTHHHNKLQDMVCPHRSRSIKLLQNSHRFYVNTRAQPPVTTWTHPLGPPPPPPPTSYAPPSGPPPIDIKSNNPYGGYQGPPQQQQTGNYGGYDTGSQARYGSPPSGGYGPQGGYGFPQQQQYQQAPPEQMMGAKGTFLTSACSFVVG